MVISVVNTIEPHHHVRSRTSHLFGGVYSMVPVQPGGSISKIAAVTQEATSISERARPRGILVDREGPATALVAKGVVREG